MQKLLWPGEFRSRGYSSMRPSLIDLGSHTLLQTCLTLLGASLMQGFYKRVTWGQKSAWLENVGANVGESANLYGWNAGVAPLLIAAQGCLLNLGLGLEFLLKAISSLLTAIGHQNHKAGHAVRNGRLGPSLTLHRGRCWGASRRSNRE